MQTFGIYTKDEMRIEKQRDRDDYEYWHGPKEEPTRNEIIQYSVQSMAEQHERMAIKIREETGKEIDEFDPNDVIDGITYDDTSYYRRMQRYIDEDTREMKRTLAKNGTLWDYADKVFSSEILEKYPVVQCYHADKSQHILWPIIRGSVSDIYDPEYSIVIARPDGEDNELGSGDFEHIDFPKGALIYNGTSVAWAMLKLARNN